MLRNGEQDETTTPHRTTKTTQHAEVILDMLEHIERAGQVKGPLIGHRSGV